MADSPTKISAWIKAGLKKPGRSKGGLAKALGVSAPVVSRIIAGTRPVRYEEVGKIAEYLGESLPADREFDRNLIEKLEEALRLQSLEKQQPVQIDRHVPVRGETAAGRWFEVDHFDEDDSPTVPHIPGRFSGLEQFAYRVVGPSMDKLRIMNGDFVVCVNYFDARLDFVDGDIVVVEKRRGQLIERTCKEVKITKEGFELWPRSTHPDFQQPIKVKRDRRAQDNGEEVEVVGLVIAKYSPMI
jgi:SOS-response transcriptional repressor LexA